MTKRTIYDVVDTITAGEFYEDYDQSVADLAILRETAAIESENGRLKERLEAAYQAKARCNDEANFQRKRAIKAENAISEASAAVTVDALRKIRHLSRLDNALSEGASAEVMSRMADIHQNADAALSPAPKEAEVSKSEFVHSATNDQIAAVMLQHGTEEQKKEALAYAGIAITTAPQEDEAVAWMNYDHVRDYQLGKTDGIAWANYERTDFYTVPLYTRPAIAEPVAVVVGHHVTQGPNVEFLTDNLAVGTKLYASPDATLGAEVCELQRENRIGALPYPDDAPVADVLAYVLSCARLWQPEARIIGNARAGDIVRALSHPPAPAVMEALTRIAEAGYHIGFIKGMSGSNEEINEIAEKARLACSAAAAAIEAAQEVKP